MSVPNFGASVVGMAEAHTLGFVGTGALGAALAAAALDHGIATSVWNRTAGKARHLVDAGATPRPTIAGLVGSSAVVVIAVSTYADVRSILDDAANVSGRTIVNLSSGTPDDAAALAGEVHRRGGRYLDGAAMSGTRLIGEPSADVLLQWRRRRRSPRLVRCWRPSGNRCSSAPIRPSHPVTTPRFSA